MIPAAPDLPPPDPVLSPITGWTRGRWEAVGRRWLAQIAPFDSPAGALPRLPGRVTPDGVRRESLETVARSFLLAAPLIAGAADDTAEDLLAHYVDAILAGTDPDGVEAWPRSVTCREPVTGPTNPLVEAANLSFGLFLSRERLWERLTRPEQRRIAAWLRHHALLEAWPNNWQLFPAMAEGFLRHVGEDASGATGARNVSRVESWHLGSGWYTDGPEHAIDYYNAWAIHPYLWAWYRMTDTVGTPEGARHLERLSSFVDGWSRLVDADGALVHVGRSLSYRTAALAALWCAEISGVNPLSPGATRRLASGVLARFVAHGVGMDRPLELGWFRPFEPTAQSYSGFGSAYLAGIGFTGLALPADAAVWTATETAPPAGEPLVLPEVGWIVAGQRDGTVRLVNHGSDHCEIPVEPTRSDPDDPHYAKLGYSSITAPGTAVAWHDGVDGHLALVDANGTASRCGPIRAQRVAGLVAGSVHLPQRDGRPLAGCAVVSVTIVAGDADIRCHLVHAPAGYRVREGGWAIAADTAPEAAVSPCPPTATVTAPAAAARLVAVHGWDRADVVRHEGANAFGDASATPLLWTRTTGAPLVLVSAHTLVRDAAALDAVADSDVAIAVAGTVVTVRRPGAEAVAVDLAAFVPWDGVVPTPRAE